VASRFSTPEAVEHAFYQAFQELDATLMGEVWSDLPETVCVHPGGDLLQGRATVLQSWAEIFASADRPSLVHRTLQVSGDGDLAVHLVEELIRPGRGAETRASRVLATNVYRRGRDGWRLLAHHASLPVMRTREAPPGRLH
jgi:ketosteroid isomerase-like protein